METGLQFSRCFAGLVILHRLLGSLNLSSSVVSPPSLVVCFYCPLMVGGLWRWRSRQTEASSLRPADPSTIRQNSCLSHALRLFSMTVPEDEFCMYVRLVSLFLFGWMCSVWVTFPFPSLCFPADVPFPVLSSRCSLPCASVLTSLCFPPDVPFPRFKGGILKMPG